MNLRELIQAVESYTHSAEAEAVLSQAFGIAEKVHAGFYRKNGEPYLSHPMAVATTLAEWHAPLTVVATGLLHDIISPNASSEDDLEKFRPLLRSDIFQPVETIVRLNGIIRDIESNIEELADVINIQHHLTSLLQQERDVVVIKIADRLHNLQTIKSIPRQSQIRSARIGFNLLALLTDRLGMGNVKRLLEDFSFEIINPDHFLLLKQHYDEADIQREVHTLLEELQQAFLHSSLKSEVYWQPASLYSLYRQEIEKNAKSGKPLQSDSLPLKVIDAGSFIVLTEEEGDCYRALGALHKTYPQVGRQFRDYIGSPKENGYRSLHTQVKHSPGNHLRVLIRTRTMDRIAELGIIARWWGDPEELLPRLPEDTKPAERQIQVFTPKGTIKYLPPEATVLDFAYHIHSDVGYQCVGALVNGERASCDRTLQSGDRVEVITGGHYTRPGIEQLELVRTHIALSRIRQWLAQHQRADMLVRGRTILDTELQPLGLHTSDPYVQYLLNTLSSKGQIEGMEDLFVSIGVGRRNASKVVDQLKSMRLREVRLSGHSEPTTSVEVLSQQEAQLPYFFARCCNPRPPDDILAYCRSDKTLAIHKRLCFYLSEREELLPVKWGQPLKESNYIIIIQALSRPGLANDISAAATMQGLDMQDFSAHKMPDGVTAECFISLGKTTSAQRNRLLQTLDKISSVNSVDVLHRSFNPASIQQPDSFQLIHPANPYGPRLAEGSRFYGRGNESRRIMNLLFDQTQNTAILLWGQKRIGKTSFMLHLNAQKRGELSSAYIDMQGLKDGSTTQFLHQLMGNITRALQGNMQNTSVPSLNKFRKNPLAYFDSFMDSAQECSQQYPIVIMLDEFQYLSSLREEGVSRDAVFSRLRSRAQHARGIHLVLCGGGLLSQLTSQREIVSLLNTTHDEKLGSLDHEDAYQLVKDGLGKIGNITDHAIDLLLDLTASHPFYLQLLCFKLFEQAQENRTLINHVLVRRSIQEWLSKTDKSRFQHFWEGHDVASRRKNKLILSAIAHFKEINGEVEYEQLARAICSKIAEYDLVRLLDDLTALGIVRHNQSAYAIEVKLFTLWLRQHWPLELVLKESEWQ